MQNQVRLAKNLVPETFLTNSIEPNSVQLTLSDDILLRVIASEGRKKTKENL